MVKWKKNGILLGSSRMLSVKMNKINSGSYECEFESEYGIIKDIYHLNAEKLNGNKKNTESHSVYFTFIHRDVRPLGRIEVLCESGNRKFYLLSFSL